jgi:arylsulfatase A-like enzyme
LKTKRKPNLLFIWTDEQRADTMAAYGNTLVQVPSLNKLAGESFVFDKTYVSQPVCTPSRSTVMTGLWPHQNGCLGNNVPLAAETPCFVELLDDPDYRSSYIGKWHLGDEVFCQHGFDEWVAVEDMYYGHFGEGRDRAARSPYHDWLIEKGYEPGPGNVFGRDFACSLPEEHCKPAFMRDEACGFLERNSDEPFVLFLNYLEPHMPFTGPLNDLHDPADIKLPESFGDSFGEDDPLRYRLNRKQIEDGYGTEETGYRELIARYYGLCTQLDRSVGAILAKLDELGLADSTIVVFTSDHGDLMGSHGMVEKCTMYEEDLRVPWLMRIPGMAASETHIPQQVSQIDLVPTLLDLMGRPEKASDLPGQSLRPLLEGGSVEEDHVFVQWHPGQGALVGRSYADDSFCEEELDAVEQGHIRTVISPDGWKLCLAEGDKSQLFNLRADPNERTNLFYSGDRDEMIETLTRKIEQWQAKTQDTIRCW